MQTIKIDGRHVKRDVLYWQEGDGVGWVVLGNTEKQSVQTIHIDGRYVKRGVLYLQEGKRGVLCCQVKNERAWLESITSDASNITVDIR